MFRLEDEFQLSNELKLLGSIAVSAIGYTYVED